MEGNGYLAFTKQERTGVINLMIILLIVVIAPKFFCTGEPVAYNIPEEELQKLNENNAQSISYNARSNDSARPYEDHRKNHYTTYRSIGKKKPFYNSEYKSFGKYKQTDRRHVQVIDVNLADTTAFIALPGIGSKLASRIVLFRDKLGGFYSIEQIREVYGLQDSVFQKIRSVLKCDSSVVKKIDVNTAGTEVLRMHPYIRWQAANALIAYRSQHGLFHSPDQLSRINNIDPDALSKMIPYLSFK